MFTRHTSYNKNVKSYTIFMCGKRHANFQKQLKHPNYKKVGSSHE